MSLVVILCGPFLSGSIGASVCHALALAEAGDVDATRVLLSTLDAKAVREHQLYWVTRANARRLAGDAAMPPTRSNAPSA